MSTISKAQIRKAIEEITLNTSLCKGDIDALVSMFPSHCDGSIEISAHWFRGAVDFLWRRGKMKMRVRNQLTNLIDEYPAEEVEA